jgi:UAA transporter family
MFNFTVMLMGSILYGVKYTIPEYICSFLVAGGVSTFALLKVGSASLCLVLLFYNLSLFQEN